MLLGPGDKAVAPASRQVLDGRGGIDRKATSISLVVVIGVREDGQKVLLALKNMGGETTEAWRAVLGDLVARGLRRLPSSSWTSRSRDEVLIHVRPT